MSCQLSPILDSFECRPSVILKPRPIIGAVSNVKFFKSVLCFNIGILPIEMFGINGCPDWFFDGVTVKVNFDDNTIEKHDE